MSVGVRANCSRGPAGEMKYVVDRQHSIIISPHHDQRKPARLDIDVRLCSTALAVSSTTYPEVYHIVAFGVVSMADPKDSGHVRFVGAIAGVGSGELTTIFRF